MLKTCLPKTSGLGKKVTVNYLDFHHERKSKNWMVEITNKFITGQGLKHERTNEAQLKL